MKFILIIVTWDRYVILEIVNFLQRASSVGETTKTIVFQPLQSSVHESKKIKRLDAKIDQLTKSIEAYKEQLQADKSSENFDESKLLYDNELQQRLQQLLLYQARRDTLVRKSSKAEKSSMMDDTLNVTTDIDDEEERSVRTSRTTSLNGSRSEHVHSALYSDVNASCISSSSELEGTGTLPELVEVGRSKECTTM